LGVDVSMAYNKLAALNRGNIYSFHTSQKYNII
jgi:hypothetical protein